MFNTEKELKSHVQLHKAPGGFPCFICDEAFVNEAACKQHLENVHQNFKCLLCDDNEPIIFTEKSFLKHTRRQHGKNDGRYAVCGICDANFGQKSQLRLHIETKCGQLQNWTCSLCAAKFLSDDALNEHRKTHIDSVNLFEIDEIRLVVPKIEVVSVDGREDEIAMEFDGSTESKDLEETTYDDSIKRESDYDDDALTDMDNNVESHGDDIESRSNHLDWGGNISHQRSSEKGDELPTCVHVFPYEFPNICSISFPLLFTQKYRRIDEKY